MDERKVEVLGIRPRFAGPRHEPFDLLLIAVDLGKQDRVGARLHVVGVLLHGDREEPPRLGDFARHAEPEIRLEREPGTLGRILLLPRLEKRQRGEVERLLLRDRVRLAAHDLAEAPPDLVVPRPRPKWPEGPQIERAIVGLADLILNRRRLGLDRGPVRREALRFGLLVVQQLLKPRLGRGALGLVLLRLAGRQEEHLRDRDVLPFVVRERVRSRKRVEARTRLPAFLGGHRPHRRPQQLRIPRADRLHLVRRERLALVEAQKAIPLGHPEALCIVLGREGRGEQESEDGETAPHPACDSTAREGGYGRAKALRAVIAISESRRLQSTAGSASIFWLNPLG